MRSPSISVVIPVFNSEGSLNSLVARLGDVLPQVASDYEVILIDDGSTDGSWYVILDLASRLPWVRGFNLMRNYGQHNALLCGIRAANFELIVTMDDDLQHPPEEIPKLVGLLQSGYDVVYGTPNVEQHGFWRDFASQFTKLALRGTMGIGVARKVGAFRAFPQHLRNAFTKYNNPFVSIDVLLTWGASRFGAVTVQHKQRRFGDSNYTFGKLVTHALNMMTGFSTVPLQFASITGFFFALFGIGVLAFVLGRYVVTGVSVPGFPFLASIIAIFSGAQLFALGIIGEYLARMHFRTLEQPAYVTRSKTSRATASIEPAEYSYEREA